MEINSINQLFEYALEQEHEAFIFYSSVANKLHNPAVKQLFHELALEEKGHAALLTRYRNDPTLQIRFKAPEHDYKIAESQEKPVLSIDMKPADAIALAMKREQEAAEFYLSLVQIAKNAEERNVLTSIANMEKEHKQKLENAFVEIGYPEVF